jgi:hypothetical protein
MPDNSKAGLEALWLSEHRALQVNSDEYEEVRIADRALVLRDWMGDAYILADQIELLGDGPPRALVVRDPSRPTIAVLVGEEGSELLKLDLERPGWTRMAELPRANNDVGGMRRLEILPRTGVTLLHWELGVLALDPSLELRWRHDLEWNHRLIHLDYAEIWFDLKYEAVGMPQRIGDEPWGFSVLDGRQLFDRSPPASEP